MERLGRAFCASLPYFYHLTKEYVGNSYHLARTQAEGAGQRRTVPTGWRFGEASAPI